MTNIFKIGKLKLWQEYCKRETAEHKLNYLFWECTLRCNLRCKHCGSSCGDAVPPGELATGEIKKAFSDIAKSLDAKKIMVAVTGGEALLRPDIFEVMKYAHGLGFPWGMVTNGTLITPEIKRGHVVGFGELGRLGGQPYLAEDRHRYVQAGDRRHQNAGGGQVSDRGGDHLR